MIHGPEAATAVSATAAASARSSSPRNATTAWPSQLRVLRSVLNMGMPFLLQQQGSGLDPAVSSRDFAATIHLRSLLSIPAGNGVYGAGQVGQAGFAAVQALPM